MRWGLVVLHTHASPLVSSPTVLYDNSDAERKRKERRGGLMRQSRVRPVGLCVTFVVTCAVRRLVVVSVELMCCAAERGLLLTAFYYHGIF